MKKIGIVIGKFFPLHIGHVNLIQRASGIVDRLYVVISYSDDADDLLTSNSRFVKEITPKDRLRFVKQTFKNQPNISSFLLDENNYSQKGDNWEEWARTLKNEIEKIKNILDGWTYERLGTIEKVLLKISFYEITIKNIGYEIAINEVLEIAKKYSYNDTKEFLNGILAKLVKDIKEEQHK